MQFSCKIFNATYGVTSRIQLSKILITELGCNVNDSTIGHALPVAISKLLFNEDKGCEESVPWHPPFQMPVSLVQKL